MVRYTGDNFEENAVAILQVCYDRKTRVATLQPLNAPILDGSEMLGVTGTGVTFYDAVQELLRGIGVLRMGNVTIQFDKLAYVTDKENDSESEDDTE